MTDNTPYYSGVARELLRDFCLDHTMYKFTLLPLQIQEVLYHTAVEARSRGLGNSIILEKVIEFYTLEHVNLTKTLTEAQYLKYGDILRTAADNNITLDQPPITFTKEEVISRIQYQQPKTYSDMSGEANIRMYVDIQELGKYMGTDDVGGAHQTLYGKDSTDSLAWILDGVHFFHHLPGSQDIAYKKEKMSFIKYLLISKSPKVVIPKITYDSLTKKFDIEDGRHRLGLYSYLGLNGLVYTNAAGARKIKELGGYAPHDYIVHEPHSPTKTDVEEFKSIGVWDIAIKTVDNTNSELEALRTKPKGLKTMGQLMAYKKAVRYIYNNRGKTRIKSKTNTKPAKVSSKKKNRGCLVM